MHSCPKCGVSLYRTRASHLIYKDALHSRCPDGGEGLLLLFCFSCNSAIASMELFPTQRCEQTLSHLATLHSISDKTLAAQFARWKSLTSAIGRTQLQNWKGCWVSTVTYVLHKAGSWVTELKEEADWDCYNIAKNQTLRAERQKLAAPTVGFWEELNKLHKAWGWFQGRMFPRRSTEAEEWGATAPGKRDSQGAVSRGSVLNRVLAMKLKIWGTLWARCKGTWENKIQTCLLQCKIFEIPAWEFLFLQMHFMKNHALISKFYYTE